MSREEQTDLTDARAIDNDRRYLVVATVCFVVLSAFVVTFSYLLNPFAIYPNGGQLRNDRSIDLFWHIRLHKPYRMQEVKAENMIFGSSRSGRLPPELLTESGESTYNASLPGGTLYEIRRQLEHANAIEPIKRAVIGLDYFMFRDDRPKFLPGFEDSRLRSPAPSLTHSAQRAWQTLEDRWSTLYSRSAIAANIALLNDIKRANRRVFFPDGTWRAEPGELAGHWVYSMLVREKFFEFTTLSQQHDLAKLQKLLQFCQRNNIELTLLLSPTHAYLMNAIDLSGGWPRYLQYQREVVEIVSAFQSEGYAVELVGFEHSVEMLYEKVTPDYQWYLDGIHYTPAAGREMMNCLMPHRQASCQPAFAPVSLNDLNVEDYLDSVSALKDKYRVERSGDIDRLQSQIDKLRNEGVEAATQALRL